MPLDPSIFSQVGQNTTPLQNPLDTMSRVMMYKSLASRNQLEGIQAQQAQQNFNDEQINRNAYNKNIKVNPDGSQSFDQEGMLKDLASSANPSLAIKAQLNIAQMNRDQVTAGLQSVGQAAQMLQGVEALPPEQREAAYQQMKASPLAQKSGSANWLPSYDQGFVHSLYNQSMDHKSLLEAQQKDQQIAISKLAEENKQKELQMRMDEQYGVGGGRRGPSGPAPTVDAQGKPIDPSMLSSRLPKSLQAKGLEEIKNNQDIVNVAKPALQAFDRAAIDSRPMTGGTETAPAAFIPNIPGIEHAQTPGQKAFMGLVNTTIKETEGTARQAAFDSVKKNYMPQTGDTDAMISSKRAAFINYLKSHASAPTNMKAGIDLSKYPSTSVDAAIGQSGYQPTPQEAAAELARRNSMKTADK